MIAIRAIWSYIRGRFARPPPMHPFSLPADALFDQPPDTRGLRTNSQEATITERSPDAELVDLRSRHWVVGLMASATGDRFFAWLAASAPSCDEAGRARAGLGRGAFEVIDPGLPGQNPLDAFVEPWLAIARAAQIDNRLN